MAAIARRTLFAFFLASPRDEVREMLASLATDLGEGNLSATMGHFDASLPKREELRYQLAALFSAYDLSSSIEIQNVEGDEQRQTARIDWYLAGRSKVDNAIVFQRREVISLDLRLVKKRWRVVQMEDFSLFAPPR